MTTPWPRFRARQIAVMERAVARAREVLRDSETPGPAVFARAFVAAGGAQVPGACPDDDAHAALAHRLLRYLDAGWREAGADRDLQRELDRAHRETAWVAAESDDGVVGFYLELPADVLENPVAEAMSHASHGLGPGVFRKADLVVLQPECDGARFVPVREHDIEC